MLAERCGKRKHEGDVEKEADIVQEAYIKALNKVKAQGAALRRSGESIKVLLKTVVDLTSVSSPPSFRLECVPWALRTDARVQKHGDEQRADKDRHALEVSTLQKVVSELTEKMSEFDEVPTLLLPSPPLLSFGATYSYPHTRARRSAGSSWR